MMVGIICTKGHGMIDNPRPKGTWPRCPICYAERNAKRLTGRRWVEIRKKVFGIYGHRCAAIRDGQRCTTVLGLQVHHVSGDLSDNTIANLRPVCPPCHLDFKDAPRSAFVDPPPPLIG